MKNRPLPRATIAIRRCAREAAGLRAACSWTRWCSRLVDANIAAACAAGRCRHGGKRTMAVRRGLLGARRPLLRSQSMGTG